MARAEFFQDPAKAWEPVPASEGADAKPRHSMAGAVGSVGLNSAVVQLLATAALMWILGRNYQKPQAIGSVLVAAGGGVWVAHLVTGHIWRALPVMPGRIRFLLFSE